MKQQRDKVIINNNFKFCLTLHEKAEEDLRAAESRIKILEEDLQMAEDQLDDTKAKLRDADAATDELARSVLSQAQCVIINCTCLKTL